MSAGLDEPPRPLAAVESPGLRQKIIAVFAVAQVTFMLSSALVRLTPVALEPWRDGTLGAFGMAVAVAWGIFNAYAEGYKGFQRSFSPRTVARAAYLGKHARPIDLIFALPFSMGLYFAHKRQLVVSWTLLVGIVVLVVAVRALPQPYRGIVDGGVVTGLAWGLLSLLHALYRFLAKGEAGDAALPRHVRA